MKNYLNKFVVSRQIEEEEDFELYNAFEQWYNEAPTEYFREVRASYARREGYRLEELVED
jgi:hypothetical protein